MYQNPQSFCKIFTPIFPSSVSTQIVSSQGNVNRTLELSQPASQVEFPKFKVQYLNSKAQYLKYKVQFHRFKIQFLKFKAQYHWFKIQFLMFKAQYQKFKALNPAQGRVGYAPMIRTLTSVNYVMLIGSRLPLTQDHTEQNINTNFNNIGGSIYGRITLIC